MTSQAASSPAENDIQLVAQSLAGSPDAFARIVGRYQSLICALAFSATGNVAQSEDLAQKTFVVAWQRLSSLREPGKLRSWLCGIARHSINSDLRQRGREPVHAAEPLESANEVVSPEPPLVAQVVTNEEVALLWREIGQLPEAYREPLVLFYREHRSVALVAEALELSEEAAMQRLSRGRKLLHERMLAFVETALERTNPGANFAAAVQAALPPLAVGSQAGAAAMAKSAAFKGGGLAALVGWMLGPFIGMFAALGLSWSSVRGASGPDERRFAVRWNAILWLSIGGLMLGFTLLQLTGEDQHWPIQTFVWAGTALWSGYLMILGALLAIAFGKASALCRSGPAGAYAARPSLRAHLPAVLGVYVASTAWIIGLTWFLRDRWTSAVLALIAVGLAAWNLRKVRGQTKAEAARLNAIFNGILCGVILVVVNLRVDRWLAPIYGVSLEEMHRLLPMGLVHLLTGLLVGWIAAVLLLTRVDTP